MKHNYKAEALRALDAIERDYSREAAARAKAKDSKPSEYAARVAELASKARRAAQRGNAWAALAHAVDMGQFLMCMANSRFMAPAQKHHHRANRAVKGKRARADARRSMAIDIYNRLRREHLDYTERRLYEAVADTMAMELTTRVRPDTVRKYISRRTGK